MDWLQEQLDDFGDDEYIIFDCPGVLCRLVVFPFERPSHALTLCRHMHVQQGKSSCTRTFLS